MKGDAAELAVGVVPSNVKWIDCPLGDESATIGGALKTPPGGDAIGGATSKLKVTLVISLSSRPLVEKARALIVFDEDTTNELV
jgi:hypothetical protein